MNNAIEINLNSVNNVNGAHSKMSDRYAFIPTKRVLDVLSDSGWYPVRAQESRTRVESKEGYQKHIVRLRNDSFSAMVQRKDNFFPELVLINSHDGGSAFKFMLGVYRLVCTNGLTVGETYQSQTVRHIGYADEKVSNAITQIMTDSPKLLSALDRFQSIQLTEPEQEAYAQAAIELKYDSDDDSFKLDPKRVNSPRRYDDRNPSLWHTFNRVQENLIKGGVRGVTANNRRRRDRAVTAIDRNVALNRALWTLTEKMAELKA